MHRSPLTGVVLLLTALSCGGVLSGCGGAAVSGGEVPAQAAEAEAGQEAVSEEPARPTDSPEAVVDHLLAADESGDHGAILEVVAPDQRTTFVWSAWFGAAYDAIAADAATVAAYQAINAEHGLDEEWLNKTAGEPVGRDGLAKLADEAFADVDLEALLADLMEFTTAGERFFGPPGEAGESGTVTVDGDRASAVVGRSELELRRLEGGRWYWLPSGSDDG